MRASLILLAIAALPPSRAAAQTTADWTVVVLMSAEYETMREKLAWSGASSRVNVVVLHDQDGAGLSAYAFQPDTNTAHPAGECCPEGGTNCCGSIDIPLSAMGLSASANISGTATLDKFFAYVAQQYPSRHVLVSARGQMDGQKILMHNGGTGGLTITQFGQVLGAFAAKRGGAKVDIVNVGLCLGGVADWAYALAPYADYYVASPNFTNAPVSVRWRIFRWTRELIKSPTMTGRELATKIPSIFAESSDWCEQNSCSNAPNEPWTVTAIDLAKMQGLARAARELTCSLLGDFRAVETQYEAAIQASTTYGGGYTASLRRPDFKDFATQLKQRVTTPAVQSAAQGVIDAIDAAVLNAKYEPGQFNGRAYGLSAFLPRGSYDRAEYVADYGPFQIDAMWRLLLDTDHGAAATPTVTALAIEPSSLAGQVGASLPVTARAVSAEYGPMCAAAVTWNAAGLGEVAALRGTANPTQIELLAAGAGVLRATYGTHQIDAAVQVNAPPPPPPPTHDASDDGETPDPADDLAAADGGAAAGGCAATGVPTWWLAAALAAALARRRTR